MDSVLREDGYSTITFHHSAIRLSLAPLLGGGWIIKQETQNLATSYELYSSRGTWIRSMSDQPFTLLFVGMTQYVSESVFHNHLLNVLEFDRSNLESGQSNPERLESIERILRVGTPSFSIHDLLHSPSRNRSRLEIVTLEKNRSLRFTERESLRKQIRERMNKEAQLLIRTFQLSKALSAIAISAQLAADNFLLFRTNIRENSLGKLRSWTVGNFLWFVQTVRGNIGYSIALAIYGPFTFYFITQPMNPHAMWAVGRVRSSFLEVTDQIALKASELGLISSPTLATPLLTHEDTAEKSTNNTNAPTNIESNTPLINSETVPQKTQDTTEIGTANDKLANSSHQFAPFALSTELSTTRDQDWATRMSSFKAMQIGYEEAMQFSARMGRLEQIETQLNFPLIVETANQSLIRTSETLTRLLKNPALLPSLRSGIESDQTRIHIIQLYLWDRWARYMADHLYVVLDASDEQKLSDFYFGRPFLSFLQMTKQLQAQHPTLPLPKEFDRISTLAQETQKLYKSGASVRERLEKNAFVFLAHKGGKKSEAWDSQKLRDQLKRQWEILYLLQNKAQEASNFGLQMYTWSIRNTVWGIEALSHLWYVEASILERHLLAKTPVSEQIDEWKKTQTENDGQTESIAHVLYTEYTSVRRELRGRLSHDIEFKQRETLLTELMNSIETREQRIHYLLNQR